MYEGPVIQTTEIGLLHKGWPIALQGIDVRVYRRVTYERPAVQSTKMVGLLHEGWPVALNTAVHKALGSSSYLHPQFIADCSSHSV